MEDQIEEKIEKKLKDVEKRILSNTYMCTMKFVEMMREDKVERELRRRDEQKERHEKERKRRQERLEKDLKRLVGEQEKLERIEHEQRQIQEIEQSRKAEEEEDRRRYEEGLRKMDAFLEQMRQNLEIDQLKEELDDKKEDDQLRGKVQSEIEEVNQNQQQEQPIEEISPKPVANKTNKTIENVHTRKKEAAAQVEIIYGDMKYNLSCKQINDIQHHLQEIERVNREVYEDEIRSNTQYTCERETEIWTRIEMKYERVLSNKFWGRLECKELYPLLEGKENKNCNIYKEQRAKIQENDQLKYLDSDVTEYQLCRRNKRWKWSQESDDASVRRKKIFNLKSSIRTPRF